MIRINLKISACCKSFLLLIIVLLVCRHNMFAQDRSTVKQNKKINILFLMSDQHRGDCIGAAGATWVKTPNMDKLASEGILFTKAYSSVPSCLPARTAILTGMSTWQHGNLGYNNIPDYPFEGPAMFTAAGYRTHAVGKNHFTPMRSKHGYQTVELEEGWYTSQKNHELCDYAQWFMQQMPGKDINASGLGYTDHRGGHWFPYEDSLHPTYWTAERAITFLQSYHGEAAWMLKVSFQRPHPPFDPPKRWYDAYNEKDLPMPKVGDWAEMKYGKDKGTLEQQPNATHGVFPEAEIKRSLHSYYAGLSFVDEELGRVIAALKARGELENTLIIYTADHGDMMGDNYIWRKCRPYEGSARIPMIIRWPENLKLKAKRGQTSEALVELRDVLPTFLDAAGIAKPSVMDGMSMLDILKGNKWRTQLDLEHAQIYEKDNAWTALTDGRYKFIYFTLTGQEQLFDLINDPAELTDLVTANNQDKKLIESWRNKMIKHLKIRGEEWVKDGKLVVQKKSIFYGVNHPKFKELTGNIKPMSPKVE